MSGELIGQVRLMSGHVMKVSVIPGTGELNAWFTGRDGRYTSEVRIRPDEITKVTELLEKARQATPAIVAAHQTRNRAVQTAEATYEHIVANAIGRSR
ncbi:hypothetical protein [Mycolicibacterium fortuitum]